MMFRFHNMLTVSLAAVLFAGLTSCGDIQQDLIINKDGSGVLETSIEMGELMGMARGMENSGSFQDSISDDEIIIDTVVNPATQVKDAMDALMDKITDPKHPVDFDTSITFFSLMPDSVKAKVKKPELAQKLSLRLKSPAHSSEMTLGIVMKFDNKDQLKEIISEMDNLYKDSEVAEDSPMGLDPATFMVFDMNMKEGWIRVDTTAYKGFAEELGMTGDSLASEDFSMMEMMFGATKVKSIVHVPGEVISCTDPEAILTKDNKVIIEYSMMDVIRSGKINGYTILFKP